MTIGFDSIGGIATGELGSSGPDVFVVIPSVTVTITSSSPATIRAGKSVASPSAAITITSSSAPVVSGGCKIIVPSVTVTITSSAAVIAVGNIIDAVNTVTMITPYGEIGSSSIGSGAIGEADQTSTRISKIPIFIVVSSSSPTIRTGVAVKPPTVNVNIISSPLEIESRARKLRILAIAS